MTDNITHLVRCASCERVLLEKKVLRVRQIADHPDLLVSDVEYRRRPWAAVVHSRARNTDKIQLPDETVVNVRDFPWVCSRMCLDAVRANPVYEHTLEANAGVRFGVSPPPNVKDGDDYLSTMLGTEGEMPETPSDEWLVIDAAGRRE